MDEMGFIPPRSSIYVCVYIRLSWVSVNARYRFVCLWPMSIAIIRRCIYAVMVFFVDLCWGFLVRCFFFFFLGWGGNREAFRCCFAVFLFVLISLLFFWSVLYCTVAYTFRTSCHDQKSRRRITFDLIKSSNQSISQSTMLLLYLPTACTVPQKTNDE